MAKEGDSLALYLVRISEMTESIKIIQQAIEGIPGGPYENLEIRHFDRVKDTVWNEFDYRFICKKPSPTFELSKQELYARVEAPKGIFYMLCYNLSLLDVSKEQILKFVYYLGLYLIEDLDPPSKKPGKGGLVE